MDASEAGGWAAIRAGFAALGRREWLLLWLLGSTLFFDGYDRGIILVALPQIRDTFGLSQSAASWYLSALYLGALLAVPVALRADRVGRKKLLIISVFGYTAASALTAVAPTAAVFTACQFVARLFLNAEAAIVWAMAAEALPARARGVGFGWLQMMNTLGVGFAAIAFGAFFHPLDLSWRWMYLLGVPPLLIVAWLRKWLPESDRFEAARRSGGLARSWRVLFRPPHRKWIVLVIVVGVLANLLQQASSFAVDFLQTQRGVEPSTASFMLIAAGIPGIPFMVLAGAASDRYGRRLVGGVLTVLGVVGALAFFWIPGGPVVLVGCMVIMLLGVLGAGPVLGAYSAELFSTEVRSQAVAWSTVASVGGQATSLALGGAMLAGLHNLSATVSLLAIGPLVAVAVIWLRFPDTHSRELEDIHAPVVPDT